MNGIACDSDSERVNFNATRQRRKNEILIESAVAESLSGFFE
jgi:hypothetical protein